MAEQPHCEVEDIEALRVLLELDLILALGQVPHQIAEAFSVAKESSVHQLELLCLLVYFEQLDKGLLEAWAAVRVHPL